MLFPTTVFALFFAIVFILHWSLTPLPRIRKLMLLGASLFFYGYWSWKFALMLLASALLNHAAAVFMHRSGDKRRRNILVLAVAANLAVLGIFKYTGFLFTRCLVPLAVPLCARLGTTAQLIELQEHVLPFISRIILPVGISFYTFQALSYVIDVYRRKTEPATTVLDFANYLSFFPQLVAGPIVRAVDLLPQMESLPGWRTRIDSGRAFCLILGGLFKKMVIANWLAQKVADPVFAMPEVWSAPDIMLGVYGYALQIYCDFSAYSDIAIGCALLLGFQFPINFNAPYFASTLQDFWRRWHISLSSWLRDYLYIPLGGSRCGTLRTYMNLMVTFLLGGIWHGAGWNFIFWGLIHGLYLAAERGFLQFSGRAKKAEENHASLRQWIGRIWVFHIVCFSWIFFRSPDFSIAREMLVGLSRWQGGFTLLSFQAVLVMIAGYSMQFLDGQRAGRIWLRFNRLPLWIQAVTAALILTAILALGPQGVAPFIYFQF